MPLLTRRHFCVAATSLLASGRLAGPAASSRSGVAQAPLPRLGVQVGILRGPLTANLERALEGVGAAGYATVEAQWYGGNFGRTPRELRRACDAAGLAMPSALVRAGAVVVGWARHLDAAAELGARYVAVVNLSDDEVQSLDDWREWDPALVALSLDPANLIRGGADPRAYLRRHRERYRLGHLKDVTDDGRVGGTFGQGRVPLAELLPLLSDEARRHQFIEQPLPEGGEFEALARIARQLQVRR